MNFSFEDNATLIALLVTTVVALVAAVIDFRRFRVPNALTFPLCLTGLAFNTVVGGVAGLQFSLGGIMLGILALLIFYIMGVMGAGDVKLLAAVGAWIGAPSTVYVFCVAGIAAGVHSLAILAWQRRLHAVPVIFQVTCVQLMTLGRHLAASDSVTETVQQVDRRRKVLPFAVMIAIGVVLLGAWELGLCIPMRS
jgi:prepilin peptidase CpaA